MNRYIKKYFRETNRYVITFFLIGIVILALGVAVSWSKRLGGYGWVIYVFVVSFWVWDVLKKMRKAEKNKNNNTFKLPPVS